MKPAYEWNVIQKGDAAQSLTMRTVSLFLYKFHFVIVAFFLRVTLKPGMKAQSADFCHYCCCQHWLQMHFLCVSVCVCMWLFVYVAAYWLSIYVAQSVQCVRLSFSIVSSSCCCYCSFPDWVFDEADHPLRIWPITLYTHNTLLPPERSNYEKKSLIHRTRTISK